MSLEGNGGPIADPGTDTYGLPDKPCAGEIFFPSCVHIPPSVSPMPTLLIVLLRCWDGVHLDTPNHKSRMQYPINGRCPTSHPVLVPQIFIELVWDTKKSNHLWDKGTPNPFVFNHGDP